MDIQLIQITADRCHQQQLTYFDHVKSVVNVADDGDAVDDDNLVKLALAFVDDNFVMVVLVA